MQGNKSESSAQRRYVVGAASDVPLGKRLLVRVPDVGEVGIFNVAGEYFAIRNLCPHQGGPMCRGKLTGTTQARFEPDRAPTIEWTREGEILRCPWHGWEFDIRTGKSLFSNRTRIGVYDVHVASSDEGAVPVESLPDAETYPVHVEKEWLILELPDRPSLGAAETAA